MIFGNPEELRDRIAEKCRRKVVGPFKMRCRPSPEKESAVLESFAGDHRFMQGRTIIDPAGNNVRVIDFIYGQTFFNAGQSVRRPRGNPGRHRQK